MTITLASSITGKGGSPSEALAYLGTSTSVEQEYIAEIWRLCNLVGFDFRILFAQATHETDNFSSRWWIERRNPAGIGITGDPEQNAQSPKFANGIEAARVHVAHMIAYVGTAGSLTNKALNDLIRLDPRYQAVFDAGFAGAVHKLGDLGNGKWATDSHYATQIAAKANAIFQNITKIITTPGETPVPELRIILNPGHRNTTGGNEEERQMTPALAQSYFDAFSAAGYETVNLGDTNGGLDETCRRMARMIASAPGDCVLLDLHYEGSPAPGVFCIVPDVTGLTTNALVPQDPADTWENNGKDRQLAHEISDRIRDLTGLQLRRGIRELGVMDESQTGVGGDGFRLATFAYTSPYRSKAVRLVVEHGNHTIQPDRAIIMQPDFTEKCAAAAVAAVKSGYGGTVTPPAPTYPAPILPSWWEHGVATGTDQHEGSVTWWYTDRLYTAIRKNAVRISPNKTAAEAGPKLQAGDKIRAKFIARIGTLDWARDEQGRCFQTNSCTPIVRITPRAA